VPQDWGALRKVMAVSVGRYTPSEQTTAIALVVPRLLLSGYVTFMRIAARKVRQYTQRWLCG
jgi:hypothetical protein